MRRHAFDTTSFVAGVVFIATGLVFALAGNPWNLLAFRIDWRWLGPVALIAIGLAVVLPALRRDTAAPHPGSPPEDPDLEEAHRELPPDPMG